MAPLTFLVLVFTLEQCTSRGSSGNLSQLTLLVSWDDVSTSHLLSAGIHDVALACISVTSNTGVPVLTRHQVRLHVTASGLKSSPIPLPAGTYTVTDFFLLKDSLTAQFATPHLRSRLGTLLERPLPWQVSVAEGKRTTVNLEVVSVSGYDAQDFGYTENEKEVLPFFQPHVVLPENTTGKAFSSLTELYRR